MFKQGPDSSLNFNWQCFPFIRKGRRGKKRPFYFDTLSVSQEFGVSDLITINMSTFHYSGTSKATLNFDKASYLTLSSYLPNKEKITQPNRPPLCAVCAASRTRLRFWPACTARLQVNQVWICSSQPGALECSFQDGPFWKRITVHCLSPVVFTIS